MGTTLRDSWSRVPVYGSPAQESFGRFNAGVRFLGWRILLTIALFAQLAYFADSQIRAVAGVVVLPQGPVTRIPSPNRHWTLIFECPDSSKERTLWVEDNGSHARKLVKEYERSLAIAWAPDSKTFFVEDAYGSNGSDSYVIDPASLETKDLSVIVANNDAEAKQLLKAGHSYVRAKRWLNSHEVIVVLSGHFDDPPPRGLPSSYTVQYRVDLNGGARKIASRSVETP